MNRRICNVCSSLTFEKLAASFLEGSRVHVGVIYPRRGAGGHDLEGVMSRTRLKVMISHTVGYVHNMDIFRQYASRTAACGAQLRETEPVTYI